MVVGKVGRVKEEGKRVKKIGVDNDVEKGR